MFEHLSWAIASQYPSLRTAAAVMIGERGLDRVGPLGSTNR
jgi:hypothetical protein